MLRRSLVLYLGGLAFTGQAAPLFGKAQTLHIALHDGFTGQTVTVTVDGRQVYHRAGVRTDLRISAADGFVTAAIGPTAEVEVTIEPGNQRAATRIDPAATPYLAIDLRDGAIHFTPSATPFVYM